jgi:hypothetical protein
MCACDPTQKTPFCGKPGCVWPVSGSTRPSALDMLIDEQPPLNPDGSQIWYAVSNPKAVRGQPMALFRLRSDAQMVGSRMTLGEIEIIPVNITLPPEVKQPNQPKPSITVIT